MIGTIVYFLIVALTIYPFSLAAKKIILGEDTPDPTDTCFIIFFGVMFAFLWPFILIGYVAYLLSRYVWRKVAGVS